MIKNIIFDWSGTLSNDLIPVYKATMKVFKILGLKKLSLEEYRREFILPYMDFYKKFKDDVDKEEGDRLFFKEINSVEEPKPFPKSKTTLELLKRKKINLALLSSHPQKKLEKEIKDYGFQKFFSEVNGGVHDKVETILGIMKRNGFESNQTAYVGDMTHDIDAGKIVGVKTIGVLWGYYDKKRILSAKPDYIAKNFKELKRIIFGIKCK